MADEFETFRSALESPGESGFAITPDDDNDLSQITRGIYVGGTGDISLILKDDATAVTLHRVVAGTVLPLRARRIRSTDTTATNLVGLL